MLGSSPRPLGGRIKKLMKQSPGWEVVHSWGHSSWLSSHRIAEESGQEGRGFEGSPWASFPEPGGFPRSPRGVSRVSCFLQFCRPSSDAAAEAASTPFPEEPWLREAEAENAQLAPRPFSHFLRSRPSGSANWIGRRRPSREALEET